jgi:hypothetical protein
MALPVVTVLENEYSGPPGSANTWLASVVQHVLLSGNLVVEYDTARQRR